MLRTLLAPSLLALSIPFATSVAPAPSWDELTDLVDEIARKRDEADPEALVRVAGYRNRAAADGLIRLYDSMGSIYMKREVLRALAQLDGVTEAEQTALQKLMDVATASEDSELREAALESLGGADHLGKSFLEAIVASPAEDEVRERAIRLHVARAEEADHAWYKELYETEKKKDSEKDRKRKKKDDDEEQELAVHRLASVREVAFDALRSTLEEEQLAEACEDSWAGIRRLALESLHERDPKKAERLAREAFEDIEERAANRALAARILAAEEGDRIADELIETADAFITPLALRFALADILAGFDDPKIDKELVRYLTKAKKPHEKLWSLRAVRGVEDEKANKAIEKLLADKDLDVRLAAVRVLGERGEKDSLEALETVVEKAKEPDLVTEAVDAITAIRGDDPAWLERLVAYASSDNKDIRNAALMRLGATGDAQYMDLLAKALDHQQWSTRYAALRGLESMKQPAAVGLIVGRMDEEQGRMLHEFADALFRMTGMPYRTASGNWKAWWEKEGDGFQLISASELEKRTEEEEERRLRQVTNVKFFGIRIVSHRVTFIIDVSGSMNDPVRTKYVGESATTTRMDVAKRELERCIDGLDRNALFNVITFSGGVDMWLDGGIAGSTGRSRDEAKEWVGRLGASGATNLYDAVRVAFDDPDVDTIFILSDGEPTAGEQTDPGMIRQHVQQWNEHRGIVIHSISVGLQLEVLRWLSEDTGGKYVQFF